MFANMRCIARSCILLQSARQMVAHCNENQSLSVSLQNVAQIQPVSICEAKCSVITVNADRADYQVKKPSNSFYCEKQETLGVPTDDISPIESVSVQMPEMVIETTVCYETVQSEENMFVFSCNSVAFQDFFTDRKNDLQLDKNCMVMEYGLPARSQSAVTDVSSSGEIDYIQPACHGIQALKAEKAIEMKY